MKERPILFGAPMVRAILAGTKTQTRRVMKPQGAHHLFQFRGTTAAAGADEPTGEWGWCGSSHVVNKHIRCPYGKPGDRLWMRETWAKWGRDDQCGEGPSQTHEPIYRADGWPWDAQDKWRPSIHMPRWASRITLEITGVRVERLQDISIEDSLAEGIEHQTMNDPRVEYRWLWESINGAGSWDANPWVWVVEFRRLTSDTTE